MLELKKSFDFRIRNYKEEDLKDVYSLLIANRPFVGLNSRYTYFLLARDFSNTCIVAEHNGRIIAFSSGYTPPSRKDTLFNWEIVVQKDYRGNGLQKRLLLHQLDLTQASYLESTVNPSNEISKKNFHKLARLLDTVCEERVMLSEDDFENDGHEAEILYSIGPFSQNKVKQLLREIEVETADKQKEKSVSSFTSKVLASSFFVTLILLYVLFFYEILGLITYLFVILADSLLFVLIYWFLSLKESRNSTDRVMQSI